MTEEWKPIRGYEGLYEASSLGRIKSLDHITIDKNGMKRFFPGKILKFKTENTKREDYRVCLWKNAVCTDYLVARVIAMTFLPTPFEKLTVNHINGNFQDNRIENLEWVTLRENIQHGFRTGLYDAWMKSVILISVPNGEKLYFKSLADASRYLKKCNGYVSGKIKRSNYCYDEHGNKYIAKLVEEGDQSL